MLIILWQKVTSTKRKPLKLKTKRKSHKMKIKKKNYLLHLGHFGQGETFC